MTIHVPPVAALLGLKPTGKQLRTFDLAAEVSKGLPVDAVERVSAMIAPDDVNFRYRIVPKATLVRRRQTAHRLLTPEESDRVARLARLWELALGVWKTEDAAQLFLATPHMLLRGRVPREFAAASEIGAREVEEILGRIKYGIPT